MPPAVGDKSAQARAVTSQVAERGFAYLPDLGTIKNFSSVSRELGRIALTTTVRLNPRVDSYLAGSAAIPPHTDHPQVDLVAWLCLRQDEADGRTLLIDGYRILHGMGDHARELESVLLPCPNLESIDPTGTWPVLQVSRGEPRLYYAAWHAKTALLSGTKSPALVEFDRKALAAIEVDHEEIHLRAGDALFVDNHRIMHARRSVAPQSRRELVRHWIRRLD